MNVLPKNSILGAVLGMLLQVADAQPISFPSLALLNTPFDELNPVITPDGSQLYFTRAGHPMNVGGKNDPGATSGFHSMPTGSGRQPCMQGP
ncbi:MAG: hypothetical protein KatS3mg032_0150 [Cyclobacteriaceae bacterium]|nr:MAG: hypothetical protein KatS3mg032_0150 [Cyclobacteriaceae bacterium]